MRHYSLLIAHNGVLSIVTCGRRRFFIDQICLVFVLLPSPECQIVVVGASSRVLKRVVVGDATEVLRSDSVALVDVRVYQLRKGSFRYQSLPMLITEGHLLILF